MTLDADGLVDELGLLTLAEAAAAVGVHRETVRSWVKRGQVLAVVHDGELLVGERSVYDCDLARRSGQGARRHRRR